jgi:hypothetical protein
MSLFVDSLKDSGFPDTPIENLSEYSELSKKCSSLKNARSVFYLSEQPTRTLALDLGIDELQTRKIKGKILLSYVKTLDKKSLQEKGKKALNPVVQRMRRRFQYNTVKEILDDSNLGPYKIKGSTNKKEYISKLREKRHRRFYKEESQ